MTDERRVIEVFFEIFFYFYMKSFHCFHEHITDLFEDDLLLFFQSHCRFQESFIAALKNDLLPSSKAIY